MQFPGLDMANALVGRQGKIIQGDHYFFIIVPDAFQRRIFPPYGLLISQCISSLYIKKPVAFLSNKIDFLVFCVSGIFSYNQNF